MFVHTDCERIVGVASEFLTLFHHFWGGKLAIEVVAYFYVL